MSANATCPGNATPDAVFYMDTGVALLTLGIVLMVRFHDLVDLFRKPDNRRGALAQTLRIVKDVHAKVTPPNSKRPSAADGDIV